jgi:YhgE/Pip-like protein
MRHDGVATGTTTVVDTAEVDASAVDAPETDAPRRMPETTSPAESDASAQSDEPDGAVLTRLFSPAEAGADAVATTEPTTETADPTHTDEPTDTPRPGAKEASRHERHPASDPPRPAALGDERHGDHRDVRARGDPVAVHVVQRARQLGPVRQHEDLTVAVASTDEGYQSDLVPIRVNVGEQVLSQLRANDQLNWVITSEDDAIDGTKSGRYYAAIVLPPTFSADMLTFYADGAQRTELAYYTNEKKNALAPKITGQGAEGVSRRSAGVHRERSAMSL